MNSTGDLTRDPGEVAPGSVNFDGEALLELTIDDTDYRIDTGKQGLALSVSSRPSGSWQWTFVSEAKWDGSSLRAKSLDRPLREQLSVAVKQALAELEG